MCRLSTHLYCSQRCARLLLLSVLKVSEPWARTLDTSTTVIVSSAERTPQYESKSFSSSQGASIDWPSFQRTCNVGPPMPAATYSLHIFSLCDPARHNLPGAHVQMQSERSISGLLCITPTSPAHFSPYFLRRYSGRAHEAITPARTYIVSR